MQKVAESKKIIKPEWLSMEGTASSPSLFDIIGRGIF